jgi:AcrR family transcriptional regulator
MTTAREVITAVGVSEPTFYNYFPTKEAVLDEFAARTLDSVAQQLRTTIDASSNLESTLRAVMALLADVFSRDSEFMAVVATRSGLFWGPSGGIIERHLGIYELLTLLFETAQQRGEVRRELDPQQLAETLAGASMVATVNWLNDWWGQPDDLFRRLDQQADVLLNGCSPS